MIDRHELGDADAVFMRDERESLALGDEMRALCIGWECFWRRGFGSVLWRSISLRHFAAEFFEHQIESQREFVDLL